MWDVYHRVKGSRVTPCYPPAGCSMLRGAGGGGWLWDRFPRWSGKLRKARDYAQRARDKPFQCRDPSSEPHSVSLGGCRKGNGCEVKTSTFQTSAQNHPKQIGNQIGTVKLTAQKMRGVARGTPWG